MRASPPADALAAVPFYDLDPAHAPLKEKIVADFADLVTSGAFTNGPHVAAFEAAFAEYVGAPRCVGLASGLDALRLGLIAAGVERGDEVLVPANTFIATFEAIGQAGAVPVPVDAAEADLNVDVPLLEASISPKTRALVPVHLYGQLADMRELMRIGSERELLIVEDACQAHGAVRDGIGAGTSGVAGAFSFYPGKNLGAFGDAGALVSADEGLVERVRRLREHGQREKYLHVEEGFTARLDTVQALVLLHKLPLLDAGTAACSRRGRSTTSACRRRRSPTSHPCREEASPSGTSTWCARRSATRCAAYLVSVASERVSLSRAAPSLGGLRLARLSRRGIPGHRARGARGVCPSRSSRA